MTYEEFLEFIPSKCMYETIYDDSNGHPILVIRLLDAYGMVNKATIKEAEVEPVAFASHGVVNWIADRQFMHEAALYERPTQEEPVACKECHLKDLVYDLLGELKVANLKLSVRAKRTWVGLTDEELSDCMDMSIQKTCRAIEAKLKEKNSA